MKKLLQKHKIHKSPPVEKKSSGGLWQATQNLRQIQQSTQNVDPNASMEFFEEEQITEEPTATITESELVSNSHSRAFVSPKGSNLVSPRNENLAQIALIQSTNQSIDIQDEISQIGKRQTRPLDTELSQVEENQPSPLLTKPDVEALKTFGEETKEKDLVLPSVLKKPELAANVEDTNSRNNPGDRALLLSQQKSSQPETPLPEKWTTKNVKTIGFVQRVLDNKHRHLEPNPQGSSDRSSSHPLSHETQQGVKKVLQMADMVKDEIQQQKNLHQNQKILKQILYFSKYLHVNSMEYLAKQTVNVDSANYAYNILQGSGLTPKISRKDVERDPTLATEFMAEFLQPQDVTKFFNNYGDILYVLRGRVKVYMRNVEKNDSKVIWMELRKGDYIDPLCPLSHFKNKRLLTLNQKAREMSIIKIWIKHSAWRNESTRFFILPANIYQMYVRNKNYLSIFSKDDLNLFLQQVLPKCSDLVSEKKRRQIKEMLKFEIIPPNTVLATEGEPFVPICYAIISGNVQVLKKDSKLDANLEIDQSRLEEEATKFNSHLLSGCRHEKVQDQIQRGYYGRTIAKLHFNDAIESDSKIFLGIDTHLFQPPPRSETPKNPATAPSTPTTPVTPRQPQKVRSLFTFITCSTEPSVVLKCLPEQLIEFLKYDRQCITIMKQRLQTFSTNLMDMRAQQTKGEVEKMKILYPVQIEKVNRNNNERRFAFATHNMQKAVERTEKMIESNLIGEIEETGTEFDAPYKKIMPPNQVGDYTGGEYPKQPVTGFINEEDLIVLQRRRNQLFQDLGSPADKNQVHPIGELSNESEMKHMNAKQKLAFQALQARNDHETRLMEAKQKLVKEMQQKGIKSKNSYVKEVPFALDILNDYRQKLDLKRKYQTPLPERNGDTHHFDEEFYNKARKREIQHDENGREFVIDKESQKLATQELYKDNQIQQMNWHARKCLGKPGLKMALQRKRNTVLDESLFQSSWLKSNYEMKVDFLQTKSKLEKVEIKDIDLKQYEGQENIVRSRIAQSIQPNVRNMNATQANMFPKLLAPIEGFSKTGAQFNPTQMAHTVRTMGTSETSFNKMTSRALNSRANGLFQSTNDGSLRPVSQVSNMTKNSNTANSAYQTSREKGLPFKMAPISNQNWAQLALQKQIRIENTQDYNTTRNNIMHEQKTGKTQSRGDSSHRVNSQATDRTKLGTNYREQRQQVNHEIEFEVERSSINPSLKSKPNSKGFDHGGLGSKGQSAYVGTEHDPETFQNADTIQIPGRNIQKQSKQVGGITPLTPSVHGVWVRQTPEVVQQELTQDHPDTYRNSAHGSKSDYNDEYNKSIDKDDKSSAKKLKTKDGVELNAFQTQMVAAKTQEFFFTLNKNSPNNSQNLKISGSKGSNQQNFQTIQQPKDVQIMNKTMQMPKKQNMKVSQKQNSTQRSGWHQSQAESSRQDYKGGNKKNIQSKLYKGCVLKSPVIQNQNEAHISTTANPKEYSKLVANIYRRQILQEMKKSVSSPRRQHTSYSGTESAITDQQMVGLTSRAFDIKSKNVESTKESGIGTTPIGTRIHTKDQDQHEIHMGEVVAQTNSQISFQPGEQSLKAGESSANYTSKERSMKYISKDSIQPFKQSPKAKVQSPPAQKYNQIFMDSIGGDSVDHQAPYAVADISNQDKKAIHTIQTLRASAAEVEKPSSRQYHQLQQKQFAHLGDTSEDSRNSIFNKTQNSVGNADSVEQFNKFSPRNQRSKEKIQPHPGKPVAFGEVDLVINTKKMPTPRSPAAFGGGMKMANNNTNGNFQHKKQAQKSAMLLKEKREQRKQEYRASHLKNYQHHRSQQRENQDYAETDSNMQQIQNDLIRFNKFGKQLMKELQPQPPRVLKIGDYKNNINHNHTFNNSQKGWSSHRTSRQEGISKHSNNSHKSSQRNSQLSNHGNSTLSPGIKGLNTTVRGAISRGPHSPIDHESQIRETKTSQMKSYPNSRQSQVNETNVSPAVETQVCVEMTEDHASSKEFVTNVTQLEEQPHVADYQEDPTSPKSPYIQNQQKHQLNILQAVEQEQKQDDESSMTTHQFVTHTTQKENFGNVSMAEISAMKGQKTVNNTNLNTSSIKKSSIRNDSMNFNQDINIFGSAMSKHSDGKNKNSSINPQMQTQIRALKISGASNGSPLPIQIPMTERLMGQPQQLHPQVRQKLQEHTKSGDQIRARDERLANGISGLKMNIQPAPTKSSLQSNADKSRKNSSNSKDAILSRNQELHTANLSQRKTVTIYGSVHVSNEALTQHAQSPMQSPVKSLKHPLFINVKDHMELNQNINAIGNAHIQMAQNEQIQMAQNDSMIRMQDNNMTPKVGNSPGSPIRSKQALNVFPAQVQQQPKDN